MFRKPYIMINIYDTHIVFRKYFDYISSEL